MNHVSLVYEYEYEGCSDMLRCVLKLKLKLKLKKPGGMNCNILLYYYTYNPVLLFFSIIQSCCLYNSTSMIIYYLLYPTINNKMERRLAKTKKWYRRNI